MTKAIDQTVIMDAVVMILKEHCAIVREIGLESRLGEDLGLDSIGLLTLASTAENQFAIIIDDNPLAPPETVGDVVALIERGLEGRSSDVWHAAATLRGRSCQP